MSLQLSRRYLKTPTKRILFVLQVSETAPPQFHRHLNTQSTKRNLPFTSPFGMSLLSCTAILNSNVFGLSLQGFQSLSPCPILFDSDYIKVLLTCVLDCEAFLYTGDAAPLLYISCPDTTLMSQTRKPVL